MPICRSAILVSPPPGTHAGTFPTTWTRPWLSPPAAPPDMEELLTHKVTQGTCTPAERPQNMPIIPPESIAGHWFSYNRLRSSRGGVVEQGPFDKPPPCPLLYQDRQTHRYCSLARLPPTHLSSAHPFSNCIFRSDDSTASLPPVSSSLTHTRRMDGFCNQIAYQLGSLAGLSFPAVYVGVVECTTYSLSPVSSSLTHTRRMDGFCNQNADQLCSLAGLSFPAVYVGVVECATAFLPPVSSSLTHTRRMDGFCNQNADQLCSLAGLSFPIVYVGVVECASASPYTYSSSTHRFPDERTPIEATPLSTTSAELGLGLGLGLGCVCVYYGLGLGSHSPSHAPLLRATLLSHNIPLPHVH
jgi:hypothetical protein